ncbi:hypothetical protein QTP70_028303, partial [Hemibagrus guttatus]
FAYNLHCWPVLREVLTEKGSVFYRISAENSLLEIQLEKLQTWLPVCYERWNTSLGTLVCRQLGHLRLTKHKGVNLTDIGQSYTDGFVQITSEHRGKLEHLWQYRGSCSTGKIIALKCFDTIRPVCLPQYNHELPGGTLCWISGWGYTQPDEGKSTHTLL